MKGFTRLSALAFCLAGLVGTLGCTQKYRDLVDPCYPERYEYMARKEVNAAFAPQVQNGHVLDQTVWNNHFEAGTANLTQGGVEHLAYLARRRPRPDTTVYLQTAQDLPYDTKDPTSLVIRRQELDDKRTQAIQDFLAAQTAGRGKLCFRVVRHDPADPGLPALPITGALGVPEATRGAIPQMYDRFTGALRVTPSIGGIASGGGGGS